MASIPTQIASCNNDSVIIEGDASVAPPPAPASSKPSHSFGHNLMPGHLLPVFPSYTGATVEEILATMA